MAFAQLYNSKEIKKQYSKIEITEKQRSAVEEWLKLLEKNQLEKEEENYRNFSDLILRDLLNYPEEELRKGFEKKNVEFSFRDKDGNTKVVIEAKGTKTKDLFARQAYGKKEQETPVIQTLTYMARIPSRFGVTTNYEKFILLDARIGDSKCHRFDFRDIKNNDDKLREFIGIFSYPKLVLETDKDVLYDASITAEKEFTEEFYKFFHETRLMMVKAFEEKENVSRTEAVYYTQIFLNRLIFIFFVEDKGFIPDKHLFSDRILHLLETGNFDEHSRQIINNIKELFISFDKGSRVSGVFGFNGSLFSGVTPEKVYFSDLKEAKFFEKVKQYSKLSKSTKLNEKTSKIIKKHPDLNPIISNLLIMDSFDFNTEVNVNILGHIFEQSISDLEELKQEKISRRKKEGVYYTPEYVTDYICRNTIIPHLSKSGKSSIPELLKEYEGNSDELETKFKEIKILDPACGSGAFLVKAIDILLELHKEIQGRKDNNKNHPNGQLQMTQEWDENKEIRAIIENNIYGVDINPESIDITKLSLFLKLASTERKLIGLSKNIKVGNSLIDDKTVDKRAFSWEDEFPEILGKLIEKKGFDIVIGNPPYIPTEFMNQAEKDYYSKNYEGVYRKYDSSILFVEKCMKIIRANGYLGFIMPLTWQTGDNYPSFRNLIFQKLKTSLSNLVNLPFDVFPDAYVDTGIAVFRNHQNQASFHAIEYQKNEKINTIDTSQGEKIAFDKVLLHPEMKVFPRNSTYEYSDRIRSGDVEELGAISESTQGIVTSKYPVSEKKESGNYIAFLLKADANRYRFQIRKKGFIDSTSIPKILYLYTQPKIMIRRIVNRQNRLMAFYEDSGIVTNKDYNPFIITSNEYDIFYILALINSRLFSYWYIKKSSLALKDDFRQTTLSEIRKFGIKKIAKDKQKNLADKAKKITELISKYFELKDKIHRRISDNFKIKINKKLENLQEMNFGIFKNEIEKIAKQKLSLQEQDEWEKYFLDNVEELTNLQNKIVIIDNEIDQEVYKLYGISNSERKLVEQNVFEQRL